MQLPSLRSVVYSMSPSGLHPLLQKIEASDVGSRLARGVFWSMAGTVVSRGLTLCAGILVARMLGKTTYGELGIIQSTVMMLGIFAGFGLGLTATKYVAEFRQNDPQRAGRIIALSGLFAVVTAAVISLALFVFAPWLAQNTLNAPHLAGLLRIGAALLFLNAITGAQTGVLSGFEAFRTIAHVDLLVGLISVPVLVCGAYFGGLTGVAWALTANSGFNCLLNRLAVLHETRRHNVPINLANCWRDWPVLLKFSLPAVLAGSVFGPVNWICSAILVNQPDGYAEMGIFNAANQWYAMMLFIPGILGNVVLPVLSNQISQDAIQNTARTLTFSILLNLVIIAPLVIVASLLSPYIMTLYGQGFSEGSSTLVVVLITGGFLAIQIPVIQLIAASGRMWLRLAMNIVWAVVFVAGTLLLIHYGAFGLATARLIGYILHSAWAFGFTIWLIRQQSF